MKTTKMIQQDNLYNYYLYIEDSNLYLLKESYMLNKFYQDIKYNIHCHQIFDCKMDIYNNIFSIFLIFSQHNNFQDILCNMLSCLKKVTEYSLKNTLNKRISQVIMKKGYQQLNNSKMRLIRNYNFQDKEIYQNLKIFVKNILYRSCYRYTYYSL